MIFLQRAGHFVTCLPNGREALSAILIQMPDVVVLDLLMPEMDGASFLQIVRSYLRLQSLPVVVWTAVEDRQLLEQMRRLKADAVLIKLKATYKEILGAIDGALGKRATA